MNLTTGGASATLRLAPALNAACQCIWLDRKVLREQLQRSLGDAHRLLDSRPGLAAGSAVFVDGQDALAMDRTATLVRRALLSPPYLRQVERNAPAIVRPGGQSAETLLGFDFHLGSAQPQLIEINTNPGGLLINLELARALTACCDQVAEPISRLVSGNLTLEELPSRVLESFRLTCPGTRGDLSSPTVAVVDDDPESQYLYPEFLLFEKLFAQEGWRALVADAAALEVRNGALMIEGQRIDLVYNRVTDFYLAEDRHRALRRAYESDLVTITPNPATHAGWADKRLLAWLRDDGLLRDAGLSAADRQHLLRSIPPTEIVAPEYADDLWRRRKDLFFKPVDGYGSKAAYRGDKLTRSTFEAILSRRYVAQELAPTSMRRVVVAGKAADLRVDVRNYSSGGTTLLRAARLYRGQTTNFRTPGGGFAPVLTLPA